MSKSVAVNIYKEKYDVYCGRAGKGQDGYFGNPFKLTSESQRGDTLEKFREYFYNRLESDPEFKMRVGKLKGKRLGCFCAPKPCHADIIAEYVNGLTEEIVDKCSCGSPVHQDYDGYCSDCG